MVYSYLDSSLNRFLSVLLFPSRYQCCDDLIYAYSDSSSSRFLSTLLFPSRDQCCDALINPYSDSSLRGFLSALLFYSSSQCYDVHVCPSFLQLSITWPPVTRPLAWCHMTTCGSTITSHWVPQIELLPKQDSAVKIVALTPCWVLTKDPFFYTTNGSADRPAA